MLADAALALVAPSLAPASGSMRPRRNRARSFWTACRWRLRFRASERRWRNRVLVTESGKVWQLAPWRIDGSGHHGAHDGDILSPMPGKVIAVEVRQGQTVAKGEKLLTLEAMKMEHTLTAPFDGMVAELAVAPGDQVQVEALLARIEAAED
jgi:acetyl/propionyl-CoA carboxylase alpha subunit